MNIEVFNKLMLKIIIIALDTFQTMAKGVQVSIKYGSNTYTFSIFISPK